MSVNQTVNEVLFSVFAPSESIQLSSTDGVNWTIPIVKPYSIGSSGYNNLGLNLSTGIASRTLTIAPTFLTDAFFSLKIETNLSLTLKSTDSEIDEVTVILNLSGSKGIKSNHTYVSSSNVGNSIASFGNLNFDFVNQSIINMSNNPNQPSTATASTEFSLEVNVKTSAVSSKCEISSINFSANDTITSLARTT